MHMLCLRGFCVWVDGDPKNDLVGDVVVAKFEVNGVCSTKHVNTPHKVLL